MDMKSINFKKHLAPTDKPSLFNIMNKNQNENNNNKKENKKENKKQINLKKENNNEDGEKKTKPSEVIYTMFSTNSVSCFKDASSKLKLHYKENNNTDAGLKIRFFPKDMNSRLPFIRYFDNSEPLMDEYLINQKFIPCDRLRTIYRYLSKINLVIEKEPIRLLGYIINLFSKDYYNDVDSYYTSQNPRHHRNYVEIINRQCISLVNRLSEHFTIDEATSAIIKKFEFELKCIIDLQLAESKLREMSKNETKLNKEKQLKILSDEKIKEKEMKKEMQLNETIKIAEISKKEKEIINERRLAIKQQREKEKENLKLEKQLNKKKEKMLKEELEKSEQRKQLQLKRKADEDAKREVVKRYKQIHSKPVDEIKEIGVIEDAQQNENLYNSRDNRVIIIID